MRTLEGITALASVVSLSLRELLFERDDESRKIRSKVPTNGSQLDYVQASFTSLALAYE